MLGFTILVVVILAIVFVTTQNKVKVLKAQNDEFTASHQGWDIYISPYNRGVIALNRDGGEAVFGLVTASKRYKLGDIASIELLRDGATLTSTNRGSQMAGAAIGGLALGGVGLLLGGLSGSKRNLNTIHSVSLKIIVDDRVAPVHVVDFFKSPSGKGTLANSPLIKPSLEKADHFHALLVTALRGLQQSQPSHALPPSGTADQLTKLWELRQSGALTDEEFAAQKALVIGAPAVPSEPAGSPWK